jgi:hypothetical protein
MTDPEILALITKCKVKSNASWEVLVARFSTQLVALSSRLSEEELYSLMEIAIMCYQKGYEEFAAAQEAEGIIKDIKRRSRRARQ